MLYLAFLIVFAVLWLILDFAAPRTWRLTQFLANRFAASGDYLPVIVTLIGGGLLAMWTGEEFLDLAELVNAKSTTLQQIDSSVHDWTVARRFADATSFFDVMSAIGGPAGVAVIAVVVAILLLIRRRFYQVAYLALTAAGGGVLDWELKRYFARARPAVAQMLMRASGYSFPSGHAMGSTVVFGALAYVAFRTLNRWRWKAAALAFAMTLIAAVALSRVYLGVHWISDVGAGITAGLLWVTVTTVAYETFRRIHTIRTLRHDDAASSRRATRGE